jgi:hypothetical protein
MGTRLCLLQVWWSCVVVKRLILESHYLCEARRLLVAFGT